MDDTVDIESPAWRYGWQFFINNRQFRTLIVQILQESAGMKPQELSSANVVHVVDGGGVRPEAVVDGAERDAATMGVESRQHHVSRVQGVDVVGDEQMRHGRLMDGETCCGGKEVGREFATT